MKNATHTRFPFLVAVAVALAVACAVPAQARVVEVQWSPELPEVELKSAAQARTAAFRRVVFAEALDILPGDLAESRQELLRMYLLPRAGDYVLSYSEAAVPVEPPPGAAPAAEEPAAEAGAEPGMQPSSGMDTAPGQQGASDETTAPAGPDDAQAVEAPPVPRTLRVDVAVNRAALKRTLRRMGVYYTLHDRQPYDLSLTGEASGAWEELGRLQALSGLTVQRGVSPLVEIGAEWNEPAEDAKKGERAPALVWYGRLDAGEEQWTASGEDISEVWFDLWGRYFSRPGADDGVVDRVSLAVRGWYAPDGVHAFDGELTDWEGAVEDAVMRTLVMLPDGIGAVWDVRTLSRAALAQRLDRELAGRGLTWEFASEITP